MIGLILFAIIAVVIVSDAFLKPSIFKYIIMLFSSIFALILSFSYYEKLGDFLLDKNFMVNQIYALSFLVITAVAFTVFKLLGDYVIRSEIKFPGDVPRIGSVICSFLFSIIVTGVMFIFFSLLPMSPKYPYARFYDRAIVVDQDLNIDPEQPLVSPDAFVAGIFNIASAGSFSSDRSFAALRADFLDSIFLNRHNIKNEEHKIGTVTGKSAIKISMSDKNTVRRAHTNLRTPEGRPAPLVGGKNLYIIKCPFNLIKLENGGAIADGGKLELLLCQVRIICNDSYDNGLKGKGLAVYPHGYLDDGGRLIRANILEVVELDRGKEGTIKDFSLAFYVPEGKVPVAIAYKQNFITELPPEPKSEGAQAREN